MKHTQITITDVSAMVSAFDVIRRKFYESNNNNVGKEISLGRSFFTWRYNISQDENFSWTDRMRFRFLYAVFGLLFESEIGVVSHLRKGEEVLKSLYNNKEIMPHEQSLVEEFNREITPEVYDNILLPFVHKHFTSPPQEDPTESLLYFPPGAYKAVFLDIMNLELNGDRIERYAILHKDLSLVHTNIIDIPSDFMEFQQVKILLEEFETIAFEILSLIYSCLFDDKLTHNLFDERRYAMLNSISLFTEKYFSRVSGYDIRKEVRASIMESNEGKEMVLCDIFFATWDYVSQSAILDYVFKIQFHQWCGLLDYMKGKTGILKHLLNKKEFNKYEKALLEEFGAEILSMLPKIHQLFTIPTLQLYQTDPDELSLTKANHESLLCFINFLLDVLAYAEYEHIHRWSFFHKKHTIRYASLLWEELTLLFTILGDIPFQPTNNNILLPQFETIAIEIGSFVYSCLFEHPTPTLVDERRDALLKSISLLKSSIKEQCLRFTDPHSKSAVPQFTDPIDTLFIVGSLIQDIENLNNSHFDNFTVNVVDQIKKLQVELNLSMSHLKAIYRMPQHRDMVELSRESITKTRDIAYEAEYLFNSHVVGKTPVWYLEHRLPSFISTITITNIKLQDICEVYGCRSKVINNSSKEALSQPLLPPAGAVDDLVVGFRENRTRILGDLIRGPEKLNTICICGRAGLGKTTTAWKLYHDRAVRDHFDIRARCIVSQAYHKRRVLIQILTSFEPRQSDENVQKLTDEEIGQRIYQSLNSRRYLIVIDDVWQSTTLDDLWIYFPRESTQEPKGSRIMLTSRIQNVAPTDSIIHSLPLLSNVQSWELLEDKVFLNESCPPQLLEIGKEIAANCGGLPLALVVTAGILANFQKKESEWERVKNQLDVYMLEDVNGYRNVLELSFEHLPNHLKLCYLYLAIFAEDTEIQTCKLIRKWIAERFIARTGEKEPEDTGKEYLDDLINRNLLVIARRGNDGEIKACTIHDLLRDMCLRRAQEENFIKYIERDEFPISEKHKCLISDSKSPKWRYLPQYCRTYIGHISTRSDFSISRMPLLRVMDTTNPFSEYSAIHGGSVIHEYSAIPEHYVIPNQVRYLGFRRIPMCEEVNFTNLEFLHVKTGHYLTIPSIILKIVTLRYLRVEWYVIFEEGCEISPTNNLRYLSRLCINKDRDMEILKCFPDLRRLKCKLEKEVRVLDYCFFTELKFLTVSQKKTFKVSEISFPLSIKKLHLSKMRLPWEKMSVIGALPNLIVLKLGKKCFVGEEWNTNEDEFPELRFLRLKNLDLKYWNTDNSDHFPQLETLVLESCDKLQEIPTDFGCHSTLQKIQLIYCKEDLKKSASSIKEEQHSYENKNFQLVIW